MDRARASSASLSPVLDGLVDDVRAHADARSGPVPALDVVAQAMIEHQRGAALRLAAGEHLVRPWRARPVAEIPLGRGLCVLTVGYETGGTAALRLRQVEDHRQQRATTVAV